MSSIQKPVVTPEVVREAARQSLKLAATDQVTDDRQPKVTESKLPEELRLVRAQMRAQVAGVPVSVAELYENAVHDEIAAATRAPVASGGAAAGKTGHINVMKAELPKASDLGLPAAGRHELNGKVYRVEYTDEGVRYFQIKPSGREQQLSFNPFAKERSIGYRLLKFAAGLPGLPSFRLGEEDPFDCMHPTALGKLLSRIEVAYTPLTQHGKENRAAFKKYKKRVNELMSKITDKDLIWSMKRLPALQLQEGILRKSATPFVHKWPYGPLAAKCDPSDFDDATVPREDITFMLKKAMDTELPAVPYSWASAHTLHDRFHNIAHFMGSTLSERTIAAALNGEAARENESTWQIEEERHGLILDIIYQAIRLPTEPVVHAEWSFPIKRPATDAGARKMMERRQFAEWGAGSAYLYLSANTKPGSTTEKALDGIMRDEIYHFVLMMAGTIAAYQPGRGANFARLWVNFLTAGDKKAVDEAGYRAPNPLMFQELAYAFMAIEKRVSKFVRKYSVEELQEAAGVTYPNQKALDAAVKAGKHALTIDQRMEKNPDLSEPLVAHYARRFPDDFNLEERRILESEVVQMVDDYKKARVANPEYWLKRKSYEVVLDAEGDKDLIATPDFEQHSRDGEIHLERKLDDGGIMRLRFIEAGTMPHVQFQMGNLITIDRDMGNMTMREIGCVMKASSAEQFAKSLDALSGKDKERSDKRKWIEDVVMQLSARKEYQAKPLPIVRDVTA